ncbi:MAG: MlaE family lipid ABC transporter permease subunit [Deltaproteobacteria bacterium]|nr:MlaE family lipid ABC transporter permease subunit [Deltaproteobacteria bacterium]
MKNRKNMLPSSFQVERRDDGGVILAIQGRMDADRAGDMIRGARALLAQGVPPSLTVDLGEVSYMDDFGSLVLLELREEMESSKGGFYLKNASENIQRVLTVFQFDKARRDVVLAKKPKPNVFERLGGAAIDQANDMRYMVSFLGSVCLALVHVILQPRSLRREETLLTMQKTGFDALPIVGLISMLLGMILAFMSSVQLKQFGADIYVASLVAVAMVRELGPVMTAIIVAGRSGSAFAAEIGTMKVSEEVDALFTMGFDPTRFLVMPKLIAATVMVPLLTMFSDLFSIAGGMLVGVFMLDLTPSAYMNETIRFLELRDIVWSFVKSGVFAMLIVWVGCLRGFQVRGGADSVGQAATSAVVSSLFLIILADSIFAVIRVYWG